MYFTDLLAAFRWWLALLVIGAAATPLNAYLFHRLVDRGYAFTKMTGLLIVSYLFWMMGSLGLLANNLGGILFALALLFTFSAWANNRAQGEPLRWLRRHWSQVIMTELLFAVVFALWVWVRAQNPAIAATEKPMEFAFLNAIGRSPTFPPLDPWLSGHAISYYYFGYVMTSLIARLSLVAEPVAFNLGIAWLVAGTAVGAFGLVYNLVGIRGTRRAALILGLIAALALPVAGNLETGLELLHGNGIGSADFWQWLDVRDLNRPATETDTPRYESSSWWWWRSSRVIHEYHLSGQAEEGLEPIVEFPGFSFVLGDMHPHVLALPFAFLSLAVALSWWLGPSRDDGAPHILQAQWSAISWSRRIRELVHHIGPFIWLFTVLLLGGLSFLNTWDVLIHLFVILGAFVLRQWQQQGWHKSLLSQTAILAISLVIPAILLYLPFYLGFRSQAGAPYLLPMLMRPTRLTHYLMIFGMPFASITCLLLALGTRQKYRYWRQGLIGAAATVIGLLLLMLLLSWIIASSADGAWRVTSLANQLGINLSARPEGQIAPGWGITAVMTMLPTIFKARLAYPWLTLLLVSMLGLVLMLWISQFQQPLPAEMDSEKNGGLPAPTLPSSALPFALLLIATGTLLTLGPEFVYLRDNFGVRLNTIFKFYYQAWVMFGVAALYALYYLAQELDVHWKRFFIWAATTGYTAALLVALLFPFFAIRSRSIEYRGPVGAETRQPATLDGLAQLKRFNPDEYQAIMWLRENIADTPVILEAVGGQYSSFARISASTGLPTVLGWAGHELQWRGSSNPEPSLRDPVVRQIYGQGEWDNIASLLEAYQVDYVYVGSLELDSYGPQINELFDQRLEIAYQNNSVTIYRLQ